MMSIKPLSLMSVGIGSCVLPHPNSTNMKAPPQKAGLSCV